MKTLYVSGWGARPDSEHAARCDMVCNWYDAESLIAASTVPLVVLGWSLGAMVSCECALRYPQIVKGLFLYAPTLQFIGGAHGLPLPPLRAMERGCRHDHHAIIAAYLDSIYVPAHLQDTQMDVATALAGLRMLATWDWHEKILSLACPVSCSADRADLVIALEASREFWYHLSRPVSWYTTDVGHAAPCLLEATLAEREKEFCEFIKRESAPQL
ncbi:alpha/beta fold hydrolase [Chrysiogenes arsenatis]|uniref:alpha/beta fold hydrolase n=1 Tax=Chrysiogenes arsenatis TaxID=309797 RepID=UPI000482001B|nr:alpha/beta hydrolase [Chrysiogenes arsenatis]